MKELWQPIPGWEGLYEVSDQGRVRSLDRPVRCEGGGTRIYPGSRLTLSPDKDGYQRVDLSKENRRSTKRVHWIVLTTFVGPCPDGMECRHLNGIRDDNRLENLKWDTHASNIADKAMHGTNQASKKLTEDNVRYIKERLKSPYHGINVELARQFGVTKEAISHIRHGRTWAHV